MAVSGLVSGCLDLTGCRILVTGGSGQIGSALRKHGALQGLDLVAPDRRQMDLSIEASISEIIAKERWSAVINCAAYTAVDKAESEPELAYAINSMAPFVLARETARSGIPLIHVSTDYVFDGTKSAPYHEDDPVRPLGVYGRTKEAGETAVRATNPRHAIIRTAWVVSAGGGNFLDTMLRLGAERSELNVVDDQRGCPTGADDIAAALLAVLGQLDDRGGTWHFVNTGEASWFELAQHIFSETARRGLPIPEVHPIPTAQYPAPAKRPANSRLATAAIARDFSIKPRSWPEAINAILAQRLD
jgi:dTDP-4-dehydrorhamnose reductase